MHTEKCDEGHREENRKAGRRRSLIQDVSLFDDSGEPVVLPADNLGPRGMFVKSDILFEPGEELWISFNVPDGPKVVVKGQIVRGEFGGEGKPAGMGITFTDLTPRERQWLERASSESDDETDAWRIVEDDSN